MAPSPTPCWGRCRSRAGTPTPAWAPGCGCSSATRSILASARCSASRGNTSPASSTPSSFACAFEARGLGSFLAGHLQHKVSLQRPAGADLVESAQPNAGCHLTQLIAGVAEDLGARLMFDLHARLAVVPTRADS